MRTLKAAIQKLKLKIAQVATGPTANDELQVLFLEQLEEALPKDPAFNKKLLALSEEVFDEVSNIVDTLASPRSKTDTLDGVEDRISDLETVIYFLRSSPLRAVQKMLELELEYLQQIIKDGIKDPTPFTYEQYLQSINRQSKIYENVGRKLHPFNEMIKQVRDYDSAFNRPEIQKIIEARIPGLRKMYDASPTEETLVRAKEALMQECQEELKQLSVAEGKEFVPVLEESAWEVKEQELGKTRNKDKAAETLAGFFLTHDGKFKGEIDRLVSKVPTDKKTMFLQEISRVLKPLRVKYEELNKVKPEEAKQYAFTIAGDELLKVYNQYVAEPIMANLHMRTAKLKDILASRHKR